MPFNASIDITPEGRNLWLVAGDGEFRFLRFSVDTTAEFAAGQPLQTRPGTGYNPSGVGAVEQRLAQEAADHLLKRSYRFDSVSVNIRDAKYDRVNCRITGLRMLKGMRIENGKPVELFDFVSGGLDMRHTGNGLWAVHGTGSLSNVDFTVDASAEMGPPQELATLPAEPFRYAEPEDAEVAAGGATIRLPRFGPVREVTLNDIDEQRGSDALDLDRGRLLDVPKDVEKRPEADRIQWLTDQGLDLVVDKAGRRWRLGTTTGNELELAPLGNVDWDAVTERSLSNALAAGPKGLEIKKVPSSQVYVLPADAQPPLTFAFRTASGATGLLQITGFTERPNSMRLRYKLVLPEGSKAAGPAVGQGVTSTLRFPHLGPVHEVTLNDIDEGRGADALDLDSGRLLDVPKDIHRRPDPERTQWVTDRGVDLVVDKAGPGRLWGLVTTAGNALELAPLNTLDWDVVTERSLSNALAAGPKGLGVQKVRSAQVYILPADAQPPLTFAFRTASGAEGVLQLTGFTERPNSVRLRYKLMQTDMASAQASRNPLGQVPAPDPQQDFVAQHRAELGQKAFNAARDFVEEHQWKMQSEWGNNQGRVVFKAVDGAGKHITFEEMILGDGMARFTIRTDPGTELSARRIGAAIWRRLGWRNPYAVPTDHPVTQLSFGPEKEVVLTEFNNMDGQEALDLDAGKVCKQPRDMDVWSEAGLTDWVRQNSIDLLVDRGVEGRWGFMTTRTAELRLGWLTNDRWQVISEADLLHTLTNSLVPLEVWEEGNLKMVMLPKESSPLTFAFRTASGTTGLLQIAGFTAKPRGVRIRYKLLQTPSQTVRLEDLSEVDRARAVALFNDIEDFGHEFNAAFTSKNLAAAETGTRRLLSLLSNFNAVVKGTGYEFSPGIFADIGKVQATLREGDWDKVQQAARHNEAYAREFKRVAARMVELAREQQAGAGNAFGPVVERVLAGAGDTNQRFIDLDKGRLFAAAEYFGPKAEPSPAETQQWLQETGIDAVADTRSHYGGLVGFKMVASPVPNEEWDRLPASRLDYYLAMSKPGTPVIMSGKGELPATYAVSTREGKGLLQIVGMSTNQPPEVRIRYKLVK